LDDLSFLKEIPDPVAGERETPARPLPPRFAEASPDRSQTRRRRSIALGLSLGWLCTHLAVYGVRPDFARLPDAYLALQIVLPALLGAASLTLAVAPGKLGLGLGVSLVAGAAVLGPLSFWLLAAGLPAPYAAAPSDGFWLGALLCLDITLAWAAAPLLLAALALRRAFPTVAGWRSALVGAGLGLLSGAAINLHCPNVAASHLVLGHGVPIALAALVGGLVVSRWSKA
jgi:hypothetical protein